MHHYMALLFVYIFIYCIYYYYIFYGLFDSVRFLYTEIEKLINSTEFK